MKKVYWWLETGFVGCDHEGYFEVEDNATEEEIDKIAREEAFDNIDWGWKVEE